MSPWLSKVNIPIYCRILPSRVNTNQTKFLYKQLDSKKLKTIINNWVLCKIEEVLLCWNRLSRTFEKVYFSLFFALNSNAFCYVVANTNVIKFHR